MRHGYARVPLSDAPEQSDRAAPLAVSYTGLSVLPLAFSMVTSMLLLLYEVAANSDERECDAYPTIDGVHVKDCQETYELAGGLWYVRPNYCHLTTKMLMAQMISHSFLFASGVGGTGYRLSDFVGFVVFATAFARLLGNLYGVDPPSDAPMHEFHRSTRSGMCALIMAFAGVYVVLDRGLDAVRGDAGRVDRGQQGCNEFDVVTLASAFTSITRIVVMIVALHLSVVVYLCFYGVIYFDHRVLSRWFEGPNGCPTGTVLVANQLMHVIPALLAVVAVFVHREYVHRDLQFVSRVLRWPSYTHSAVLVAALAHVVSLSVLVPATFTEYVRRYYSPKLTEDPATRLMLGGAAVAGIVLADMCLVSSFKKWNAT